MRNTFLTIIVLSVIFSACKKDPNGINKQFEASHRAWLDYKASVNNSYQYITFAYYGGFTNPYYETKITVQNGVVIARAFTERFNSADAPIARSWAEDKSTLNTHNDTGASPTLTLDDIYAKAQNEWLAADPAANNIYFETNNNGLISNCSYEPKSCPANNYNCAKGIYIKSITAL